MLVVTPNEIEGTLLRESEFV
ncbi:hypothetical protein A2U01_0095720, partial [Trifolium medium]|nr:hypothetical protein [Trifolium medium]